MPLNISPAHASRPPRRRYRIALSLREILVDIRKVYHPKDPSTVPVPKVHATYASTFDCLAPADQRVRGNSSA